MNTQVKAATVRLTVAGFLAAAILVVSPFSSKANENKEKETKTAAISASQVSVKYAGTSDNSVVFRVKFHNPTAQKFNLIIKNEAGEVLYSGQYSDVNFTKTVHLLQDADEMNPTFIIRSGNQTIENSFAVTTNVEESEKVVVTRL